MTDNPEQLGDVEHCKDAVAGLLYEIVKQEGRNRGIGVVSFPDRLVELMRVVVQEELQQANNPLHDSAATETCVNEFQPPQPYRYISKPTGEKQLEWCCPELRKAALLQGDPADTFWVRINRDDFTVHEMKHCPFCGVRRPNA